MLPAAVKQRSPIQGTNCTADLIALRDPKSSTGYVRANPFGDGYAINWSHRCAKAYVQSCANLLAIDYEIDFLKIDAVSPGSANNNATDVSKLLLLFIWLNSIPATLGMSDSPPNRFATVARAAVQYI